MKYLYRVTYGDTGIFDAYKQLVSREKWEHFSKYINWWLPEPKHYKSDYKSYFTEDGFRRFERTVLPHMLPVLNQDLIIITRFEVLEDEWQVITNIE